MGLLRLALAISVLCTHLGVVHAHTNTIFGCTFLDGTIAVETFFMISGFYMALVLHEKYLGKGSYLIFLTQRLLRLFPTYLVTLLIFGLASAILVSIASPGPWAAKSFFFLRIHAHQLGVASMLWVALSNLLMVGLNELCYLAVNPATGALALFDPAQHRVPGLWCDEFIMNPPAWSVSLEIYFYILAPTLVRSAVWMQVSLILASVTVRYFLLAHLHWSYDPFVYRNFACQIGFFVAGSLAYRLYTLHGSRMERWGRACRHGLWPLALLFLFYRRLPWTRELYLVAIPILFILIPVLFALTRHNATDRFLGELSYPFYLGHVLILVVAYYLNTRLAMVWVGPCCLLATLVFSWILYRGVESWSERFRARLYHRQRPEVELSPNYFPTEVIDK